MASGLIGALRVTLGIDSAEFEAGTSKAEAQMRRFQREFARTGKRIQQVGQNMSTYLTLPILGAGAAIAKTAGDFETAMNQLQVNAGASAKQLAAMREEALKIGSDTSKSASEAADAMNMLAKNGMDAANILNGGARAAVILAEATGSQLDPAAAAITDTFNQFGMTAKDLPTIINRITGAVNESKFDFDDFQLAMGQAGAVASASGLDFNEFTAALAGTSSMFASGSDAGTSLKVFLQRLAPETKKAANAIDDLGLSFYDAQGNIRPLREIAEQLKRSLSGLSEEDRNARLKAIFGTDAMRTAIGLMKLGAQGIDEINAKVGNTVATDQAAARMKGFNGELEKLKGALETLAIRIADSGMLEALTDLVKGIADIVDVMGQASPEVLRWGTILAGLVAIIGPVVVAIGSIVSGVGVMLPLLAKLGPVITILTTGFGYLIPVIMGVGRALLLLLANPVVLGAAAIIGGIYLAWKHWDKIGPIVQRLYNQVTEWIGNKLTATLKAVLWPIEQVRKGFFKLYDAVVGHSYIPDMVDGIGKHMARLQETLVAPAVKSTEAAKEAFQRLQQDVSSLLARLYPDETRHNQFLKEMEMVERGMKKLGFTAEQIADAIQRLRNEFADDAFGKEENWWEKKDPRHGDEGGPLIKDQIDTGLEDVVKNGNRGMWEDTRRTTQEMTEMWADFAVDTVASVKDMVSAFKSGDIMGGIIGFLDLIKNVIGALQGIGVIPSAQPSGGGVPPPGYSTGGDFKVGGSGGVDSQLVQFRATPGEHVAVRRGDQMDRKGQVVVRVVKGEMFDAHVEKVARPMAEDAAQRGAAGGAGLAARNSFRQRRSALA